MRLKENKEFIKLFGLTLALVLLAALPSIFIPFAQNDDYFYFYYDNHSTFLNHPQYSFFILTGRVLYTKIAHLFSIFLTNDLGFAVVRLLYVFILVFSICLLYYPLKKKKFSDFEFVFLCVGTCLLPGFLAGYTWVTMAPFAVGLLLAVLPANYLLRNPEKYTRQKLLLCLLGFMASFFTYQPWPFVVLAPLFFISLDSKKVDRRFLGTYTGLFLLAGALHFLIHRLYLKLKITEYLAAFDNHPSFSFSLSNNPFAKFITHYQEILMPSFKFWFLNAPDAVAWVLLAVLLIYFIVKRKLFAWGILFLTLCPFILVAGGHTGYRVLVAFEVCLFILLFNVLRSVNRKALFIIVILAIEIAAFRTLSQSALNNFTEYFWVKNQIVNKLREGKPFHSLHIIPPNDDQRPYIAGACLGNGEFVCNSTYNASVTFSMVRKAFFELGFPSERTQPPQLTFTHGPSQPASLIIDMDQAKNYQR